MSSVDHKTRKHAILSASGSSRWLNCTPSAILEDKYNASNPEKTSIYALEGTLAHEYSDIVLRYEVSKSISEKVKNKELKKLERDKLFSIEMPEEVQKYVDHVRHQVDDARRRSPDAIVLIEERLDFSHIVEKGFGTGDVGIISDGIMEVIDLKYGKGVKVMSENNTQMMLYASGMLRSYEMMYDIHTVKMTIVQPRLDHVDSWEISVEDLETWGEEYVKPRSQRAIKGEGEKVAGPWCKFCKVAPMCNTLSDENVKLAKFEFADPHLLDNDTIAEIFSQSEMLSDWVNNVKRYILDESIKGTKFKGLKLVEGRSDRRWLDEDKIIEILKSKRFSQKDYLTRKLKGIGAIEKLIGKKDFYNVLGENIVKPPGAPTVVPNSDPRPAFGVEQAKLDFKD